MKKGLKNFYNKESKIYKKYFKYEYFTNHGQFCNFFSKKNLMFGGAKSGTWRSIDESISLTLYKTKIIENCTKVGGEKILPYFPTRKIEINGKYFSFHRIGIEYETRKKAQVGIFSIFPFLFNYLSQN